MITEVNAVNFRQNLGEMLNQVQFRNDSIVINKDGKPVAALVDATVFEFSTRQPGFYGAIAVLTAVVAGWLASLPFRGG